MHLEREADTLLVEDVHDRPPALRELLVAAVDDREGVRRDRVEQVPRARPGEAGDQGYAGPRGRTRRVLHPLRRALAHSLRIAVAPDVGRQDPVMALVDRVAYGLTGEVRADREDLQVVA